METKKITKATFKAFLRKHEGALLVRVKSEFDGMVDGCVAVLDGFTPAQPETRLPYENTLGVKGVWLVGGGRNSFVPFSQGGVIGIQVYNCCGCFSVGVRAEVVR
jgi:hypothetical protein